MQVLIRVRQDLSMSVSYSWVPLTFSHFADHCCDNSASVFFFITVEIISAPSSFPFVSMLASDSRMVKMAVTSLGGHRLRDEFQPLLGVTDRRRRFNVGKSDGNS